MEKQVEILPREKASQFLLLSWEDHTDISRAFVEASSVLKSEKDSKHLWLSGNYLCTFVMLAFLLFYNIIFDCCKQSLKQVVQLENNNYNFVSGKFYIGNTLWFHNIIWIRQSAYFDSILVFKIWWVV